MCAGLRRLLNKAPPFYLFMELVATCKTLVLRFWPHRYQFLRYFVTGVSAVILDIGTLYILKEFFHLAPVTATMVNQILLVNYVFFVNKKWSFGASGNTHRQIVRFYILSAMNYVISVAWMWLGHDVFEFHYLLVRIANIILAVGWNFLLYKFWVYKS